MHNPAPPFAHTSGPHTTRIALVGEAWGEKEELTGLPFMGWSGDELTKMLHEAGINRAECFLTNVLALRPPGNKLEALCAGKAAAGGPAYTLPPIAQGKYLLPEFLPELTRLFTELRTVNPNVIIALGNTACWALLHTRGISALRGTVCPGVGGVFGLKVIPTYHPAGVLRQWSWRPIVVADLMKARREALFPEIRRPVRHVLVSPTLSELHHWFTSEAQHADTLSIDIETGARQIKCVGFATSRQSAAVVPFVDLRLDGGSYWPDVRSEVAAWQVVRAALELPCPKLFQNGLYDLQYLARMGFRPRNCIHDTMLLHHSLYPEMQKGLGFLGSLYSSEAAWKLLNRHQTSTKRDE